ncbi:NADPH oxidase organizer 1a [Pimephales promelas]|uniref:NADPH oxidase organizer 1a n=1 Tax=Pimephales promelas TaxID=90988 RepID=UPI001955A247|nr:NADPH oxidase organizer 1a [Pimephales promelas]KAG1926463.1 NADPH oxidase organizer [Pimephales promelas]
MEEQRHPVNIQLVGVMQKEEAKLYMTTVLWSDQNEITVYRSLEDFKTLHRQLKKKFPPSNPIKRSTRIVPKFKAARVRKNMQKWSPSKSVLRLKTLDEYCSELLKSDRLICQSQELIQFLLPKSQDLNADFAKNSIVIMPSEATLESSKDGMNNGVTQPFVTETYRCVATYETKDTKNQPFKVEVDEVLDVLIKDQNGWWLVENEAKRLAWFPAPYLQRAEMADDGPDVMDGESVFYVAAKSFKATNSDEISVEIGSVVEVLQKSDNGWWIVRYNRKAGFAPSMYLQPYNNPRIRMMPAQREMTSSTLDLARLRHTGDNSLQGSDRKLSRSQGNLYLLPGSTLDPKDKLMSRSMGRLPDARTTWLTPSIRVQFAENGQQRSMSEDSEVFSDESSFSGSDSLNRSDAEQQFRHSRTPMVESSRSLSVESPTEGKMTSSRSDPSLNKIPSTPKMPPRPQAQEILKRCTTVTRQNLQRTS